MTHTRKHSRSKHYRRRHHRGGSYFHPSLVNAAPYSGSGEGNSSSFKFGDLSRQTSTVSAMPYSNNTLTAMKEGTPPNANSLSSVQSMGGGRRRRRHSKRRYRGGQAATTAPTTLSPTTLSPTTLSPTTLSPTPSSVVVVSSLPPSSDTPASTPIVLSTTPISDSYPVGASALKGGRRRRSRKYHGGLASQPEEYNEQQHIVTLGGSRRKRRGGNVALGAVVSQAVVPFTLLGVQNRFGNRGSCSRRRSSSRRTRRR